MFRIGNIKILIDVFRNLKDFILHLSKLDKQISDLSDDVDNLWKTVSLLINENQNSKIEDAKLKGFLEGMEKTLFLQNQMIQILLVLLKERDGKS